MTPRAPSLVARMRSFLVAKPLVALVVVMTAGLAAAAVAITYTTPSTVSTSVAPPPVQFLAGTDAGPSALTDYVSAYSISTNKTYFSATVNGVPEATLTVGSFFRLTNVDDASHAVTLSTPQVSNAKVSAYTLKVYDSSDVLQGTLTLTDASPSASFTLPAGATWYATLTLTLATGAGADNVALTNTLSLSVT